MEINSIDRLQFRHHSEVFTAPTLEEARANALNYVYKEMWYQSDDECGDPNGHSLYAEPTVLRYGIEGEEDVHIIVAIGAETNNGDRPELNKFCIIDINKIESEIEDIWEEIERIIKMISFTALTSDTIALYSYSDENGTVFSGDVKTEATHWFDFDGEIKLVKNNILVSPMSSQSEGGLFVYVNLDYDKENEIINFYVSNADGTVSKTTVELPNNYLVKGEYSIYDESLHLTMKNGDDVKVPMRELIDEWDVEGEASSTPIVLNKEHVTGTTVHHQHSDILRADVRVDNGRPYNILEKSSGGRYLYVRGHADNIRYDWNGQSMTVNDALNDLKNIRISPDRTNIIQDRADGFFANTTLDYISSKNTLVFKTTNVDGTIHTNEIELNSVDFPIDEIYYDSRTETLIIKWRDQEGKIQTIKIPLSDMIDEWEVLNPGHNVTLTKVHKTSGKDQLSADVNIYGSGDIEINDNNILEDRDHSLYVKGTADNIKYKNTTVEGALYDLDQKIDNEEARAKEAEQALDGKIDGEAARAREAEADLQAEIERLDNTLGSGFTTDTHETVTYKFNQLQDQVNSEAQKLQNEIDRSTEKDTEHDGRLDAIDAEIGEGFGPRNTVRDEIDAVSADTLMRLTNVINEDESIDVETRNDDNGKPTIKVVKVNLSTEVEDDRKNIIKLNSDGLFANVDLSYEKTANKLIFHTSNGEPDKEIQLESMSSIISIEYNPTKEAIIITYMTNGHEIKTVEIPVGDLINEWRVEDGHPHAVQLEKVRIASGTSEQDVLKASVIITDEHADNILVMDDGALYVSNSGITANAAAIEALDERTDIAEGDIAELKEGLREEISARTLADDALGRRIDKEIEDRIADVNEEEERARDAELALSNKIDADVLAEKNRAEAAETTLDTKIDQEIADRISDVDAEQARAEAAELALSNKIDADVLAEKTRAEARETELDSKIDSSVLAEKNRAEAAELALSNKIDTDILAERNRAVSAETALHTEIETLNTNLTAELNQTATNLSAYTQTSVNEEKLRAMTAEGELRQAIQDETVRANAADAILSGNIQNVSDALDREVTRATTVEDGLQHQIDDNKVVFDDTASIDFSSTQAATGNVISAEVKLQEGDNIIKIGQGLYATAHLEYDAATNKIKFTSSAGISGTTEEYQLSAGSIIDNLYYDNESGEIVITYHTASGEVSVVRFPASELFNPWIVQNLSEGSAIELIKTPAASQGDPDILNGRVLLTNLDDNAVQIVNNGLYVSGSEIGSAQTIAACVRDELKVFETAVIGNQISEECGNGYTYQPNLNASFINVATSFANADFILDSNLKAVKDVVESISGNSDCANNEIGAIERNILGLTLSGTCGTGEYDPQELSNYIYDATSFMDADVILDKNLRIVSGNVESLLSASGSCTPSTRLRAEQQGLNKILKVDVTLSSGTTYPADTATGSKMEEKDLIIGTYAGNLVEPGDINDQYRREYTDTNVLRIANVGGTDPAIATVDGLYLSNYWNCGKYYQVSTEQSQIDLMKNTYGYELSGYVTDETTGATNYNYNNNVRQ